LTESVFGELSGDLQNCEFLNLWLVWLTIEAGEGTLELQEVGWSPDSDCVLVKEREAVFIRDEGTELESLTEWLLIMEDLTHVLQEVSETERGADLIGVGDELGGQTAEKYLSMTKDTKREW
jgi:hypothetical protein